MHPMPAPSAAPPLYDLRTFFRTVGARPHTGALTNTPTERVDLSGNVTVVDEEPAKITVPPLTPAGFIDGVQSALVVTYRAHRPIYLTYQAAGAVGPRAQLVGLKERLTLLGSKEDAGWVEQVNTTTPPIPFDPLPATDPMTLEREAHASVGDWRDRLERTLVEDLVDQGVGPLVVDGSLRGRPHNLSLRAVVKDTSSTRYLPNEAKLYALPVGWRSPVFHLPAGRAGATTDRYSCYVRLHDATTQAWNFGLVRLEAFDPEHLMPLAALALAERQGPRSGDGRWDRHLASVAVTEKVLRSRRPAVFDF